MYIMDQPKWLSEAWRELGQREVPGAVDNARVVAMYRDAGHGELQHDETAWCAAFAGACLVRAGLKGSGSLMARSYLSWGEDAHEPRTGAIAVLSRGGDPALGHVGLLIGETEDSVILLGGNQGDAVSVAAFPRSRLLGLRWPAKAETEPTPSERGVENHTFSRALAHVLQMEGGFTDDAFDPGGPTNKGITLRVFAEWKGVTVDAVSLGALKEALRHIPDDAVIDIYGARYWQPASCPSLPPALALFHFDAAVNHGAGTANRILQEALGVTVDGEIGPETLVAIKRKNLPVLLERYAALRRARYRALNHFWRFGRGWLARVDKTLSAASAQLAPKIPKSEKGQTPMTSATPSAATGPAFPLPPKWWGDSLTIWGALTTALATVLPVLATAGGISLTPDIILDAGTNIAAAVQAIVALAGTLITIYGRVRATQPLERRNVTLKL
jgi:uncharacterized protein (TIGR02594 family)